MPPRIRLVFIGLALMFLLTSVVPLFRELTRRRDIWWTPPTMLVPLAESTDRVVIYVGGRPLTAMLEAAKLGIDEDRGARALSANDFALRFNNWDRVRGERLPGLLMSAAGSGVALCLLVLIVTGRLAYRPERTSGGPS